MIFLLLTHGDYMWSNVTLTIQAGTHIYLHADTPVFVDGSLNLLEYQMVCGIFYRRSFDYPILVTSVLGQGSTLIKAARIMF
jgi:hypothetical protein